MVSESKTIPELYFFDVVGQTNAIIHLFEKQFSDSLIPLVSIIYYFINSYIFGGCLAQR